MASADRRRLGGLIGCVLMQVSLVSLGAEPADEQPDIDLLAYLGSWGGGSDEDWMAVAEWDGKADSKAPAPEEPAEEQEDE
jgi:hypothetical protein